MANPFPKPNEQDATSIIEYQIQATQRNESVSLSRLIELEVNRQYYSGNQWNEVAQDTGPFDQAVTPMTSDDKNIPMPVINRTAAIVDGEAARLISSTLKPRVDPNDRTTKIARAAKLSNQVLDDICQKNSWVRVSHQDRKDCVIFGTSFMLTELALDVDELREIPASVLGCGCGWKVSADKASKEGGVVSLKGKEAEALGAELPPQADEEQIERGPIAFLDACPSCGGEINERISDDAEGEDSFGNPLTKKIPSTKIAIRNISVFDVCPEGGGRTNDGNIGEYTIESIVPVDWVAKRHTKGKDVKPKTLQALNHLLKWHPSGIDYSGTGGYFGSAAFLSEERWASYRMTIRKPFFNFDTKKYESDGRLIISANNTVLYHGPLMIHHPASGRRIPRVMLHPAQYTQVEGSIFGIGAVRRVRKMQDAINTCVAQAQYGRHVWGNPRLFVPQGTSIEYQGQTYGGYQGDTFTYSGDEKPTVHEGTALHPDWHSEVELYFKQMSEVSNQADIDRGVPPGGVPSASGLMYLGEQAGTARKPLSQRFAEREQGIFRHVLELANATMDTPTELMVADRGDKRTIKTFTGTDLMWQLDVKVEVQPAFDSAVFRRQATQEALQSGLLQPQTPLQQRRIAEAMGVPSELDSVPSQQIENAENEWIDFIDDEEDPVVSKEFDDHGIHIEQHFTDFRSADGQSLYRFRNLVELATEGVDEQIAAIGAAEDQLKVAPPGDAPMQAEINPATGLEDPISAQMQMEKWAHDLEMQKMIAQLPKNTELRIFFISKEMLMKDPAFMALEPEDGADALRYTRWLSHIKSHRIQQTKMSSAAAMGLPVEAAPGGSPEAAA